MTNPIAKRLYTLIDRICFGHRNLLRAIHQLKEQRNKIDDQIKDLGLHIATMDGDQKWFSRLVSEDPTCAMRIIKECKKKNATTA